MTMKLQAKSVKPLDLQFVPDIVPKLFLTGRRDLAKKTGAKSKPVCFMHVQPQDIGALDTMLILTVAAQYVLALNGRMMTRTEIETHLKEQFSDHRFLTELTENVYAALEQIAQVRDGQL
jgi:hypothetical protein